MVNRFGLWMVVAKARRVVAVSQANASLLFAIMNSTRRRDEELLLFAAIVDDPRANIL
jgi:hypothetical protein